MELYCAIYNTPSGEDCATVLIQAENYFDAERQAEKDCEENWSELHSVYNVEHVDPNHFRCGPITLFVL